MALHLQYINYLIWKIYMSWCVNKIQQIRFIFVCIIKWCSNSFYSNTPFSFNLKIFKDVKKITIQTIQIQFFFKLFRPFTGSFEKSQVLEMRNLVGRNSVGFYFSYFLIIDILPFLATLQRIIEELVLLPVFFSFKNYAYFLKEKKW